MFLLITFDDFSTFTFCSKEIEASIDVLSSFVADGRPIKSAVLLDANGTRTVLPVEVFDGELLGKYIVELATEYQQILAHKP